MIVVHMSFEIPIERHSTFDAWVQPIVEAARRIPGCVAYECLTDPADARRRVFVEAWSDDAALAAHRADPPHAELLALGSARWGMCNMAVNVWSRAEGHSASTAERTDALKGGPDGRDELRQMVMDRQLELGIVGPLTA